MAYEILKAKETSRSFEKYTGGHEDRNIVPITEESDLAGTIKELNDDKIVDKFSNIDMKTRLLQIEISSIIAVDSLIALDFLPQEVGTITRSKKRLAVSLNGLGRSEIVSIAQGVQEQTSGKSMFERIGGMFGGGKK